VAVVAATLLLLAVPSPAGASVSFADRDGDKVFDDLERRLAGHDPSDRVAVIVTLDEPATADRVNGLAADVGGFETVARFSILDGFAARMTKSDVRALAANGAVAHVELDLPVHAANNTAQDSFGVTKARLDAGLDGDGENAPAAYSKDDLVAAVVDTGIDAAHQDLDEGKVLAFANCLAQPCALASPVDPNGHGTHVAATIAGEGDARPDRLYRGVAPAAALVGVRALDASGNGYMSDVVSALGWIRANRAVYGIEVVNLSLGADGCGNGADATSVAVSNAVAEGLVVVVSAGNEGPDSCTVGSPAAAASALTVGAMADVGEGGFKLAPFSSRGPTADGRVKPDLVGPGVRISSAAAGTSAGYATYSGTSMAAPFVAGVALLMLEANGSLTPAAVKAHLMATAIDWGAGGGDPQFGAGRLDAYAALAASGAPLTSPPTVPTHLLRDTTVPPAGGAVDYPLVVTNPGFPVGVTVTTPTWSSGFGPFFNVQLLSPGGSPIAFGTQTGRHSELTATPSGAGTYVLRVASSNGGAGFTADVSGGFAPAPLASVRPAISGTAEEGATLVGSDGTWSGSPPISFSYAWRRCNLAGSGCVEIPGATAKTYLPSVADVGSTLRIVVTATDSSGSAPASSDPTPLVAVRPDRFGPLVRALVSSGRRGRSLKLLYRVSDEGGRARERVKVFRGSRVVRTLSTRLSTRETGRTDYVFWRAPRSGRGFRFCVEAWDVVGNAATPRCAAIRLRK